METLKQIVIFKLRSLQQHTYALQQGNFENAT